MNMCRICLTSCTQKNLNQLKSNVDGTFTNHVDIFMFCFNIQIEPNFGINTKLCVACFDEVLSFYEFKLLALKSDSYWRTRTLPEPEVFLEDIVPESDVKSEEFLTHDIKVEELDTNGDLEATLEVKEEISQIDEALQDGYSDDEPLNVLRDIKDRNDENKNNDQNDVQKGTIRNSTAKRQYKRVKKHQQKTTQLKNKRGRRKLNNNASQICDQCGKVVKHMVEHQKRHLPPGDRGRRTRTEVCGKSLARASARAEHYHVQGKTECPICKKYVKNMKMHHQISHDKASLKFGCVVCGRRFYCKSVLSRHMVGHTNDKPFQCDTCLHYFSRKLSLVQHIRAHHLENKPYICHYCSKGFIEKAFLISHIRSHTNERPFKCPECGKRFADPAICRVHVKRHSGGDRASCTQCNKIFTTQSYLKIHMRVHTKEKPYQCRYCEMKFGRKHHCETHEERAHTANKPPRKRTKAVLRQNSVGD